MITMNKHILSFFLFSILVCVPSSAAKKNVRSISRDRYTITAGDVVMTIDAREGARIQSLKYMSNELINQDRGANAHGSTFWTSPQKDWGWPPVPAHDSEEYSVEMTKTSLTMTSQLSERFPYRIIKEFTTDKKGKCFIITYTIVNESSQQRPVAPWEITRVPAGGVVFFDCPVKSIEGDKDLKFKSKYGYTWYEFESNRRYRKANIDTKGWMAYANNGLLFVKKFDDIETAQAAPGEAEGQLYVHNGTTYYEVENQGEYTTLKPGESVSMTVRWYLQPLELEPVPSKELAKKVKKIVK